MIIKRKYFSSSFFERLGGNKELKERMLKAIKSGNIDSSLPKELPDDLKRYITFLQKEGINNRETMGGSKGTSTTYALFGAKSILNQISGEKIPFDVRRTGKKKSSII